MTERTPTRIACVDFGGTKGLVQVLGLNGKPLSVLHHFEVSKDPNNRDVDYSRLAHALHALKRHEGFDAIVVGFAGEINDGLVVNAGNLTAWQGTNVREVLHREFNVPVLVDNDGAMLVANEIVFGVLRKPTYAQRKGGLLVAPGTGVAVTTFLRLDDRYKILPGEGAHMTVDFLGWNEPTNAVPPCGCGQKFCVESRASGRVLEAEGDPEKLSNTTVNELLAPSLGALIANVINLLPGYIEVVLIGGGIPHKRSLLRGAIEQATATRLNGSRPTPPHLLAGEAGGTQGCLAYYLLEHGITA